MVDYADEGGGKKWLKSALIKMTVAWCFFRLLNLTGFLEFKNYFHSLTTRWR
jgi:hypothetical protein